MSNSEVEAIGWTYWRKSLWNGTACPPVILELKNSSLLIRSEGGVLATARASQVAARYTALGALRLSLAGSEFTIINYAGPAGRSPSRDFVRPVTESPSQKICGIADWGPVLEQAGVTVEGYRYSELVAFGVGILVGVPLLGVLVAILVMAMNAMR